MRLVDIPGYEGYFADADGNIYSSKQSVKLKRLSPSPQKARGKKFYMRVKIAGSAQLAHRVLASVNIGRALTSSEVVNHIDGDTMNNRLDNLEVTSHKGNVDHAVKNGLYCSGRDWYVARGLDGMLGTAGTFND